ncbi:polysaccharide biosynthesis tyrosine autokinase [Novosphingobium sp. BL-8H]|uniref:GumC family protein n=1 Tax=Novosphingobium sp. BL-8H TaxID=3127640 RepID=UPI0037564A57
MNDAFLERDDQDGYAAVEESGPDLSAMVRAVVGAVRRNWALIAGTVGGIVLLGVAMTLLVAPKYRAQVRVLIEDQADQIIEGTDLQKVNNVQDTDRFLQTQVGIIQSRSLAQSVVESGKLDRDAAFFEAMGQDMPTADTVAELGGGKTLDQVRKDAAIEALLDNVSVDLPPDSRIVSISVSSRSPTYSAKLAQLYGERFIDRNLDQKYNSSSYARRFLSDQLDEARDKVTQSERDLNQYARAAGLIRVTSQSENGDSESVLSVTNSTLVQLTDAASKATATRIAAEDRWRTLAKQDPLSIPEVNGNPAISTLLSEKAKVEADLAEEQSRHLDDFVTVKSKKAEVAEYDRRIDTIAQSLKKTAYLEYQAALEQEKSLTARVGGLRGDALKEQDRGVQYAVLKRVADTNRTLYDTLLSRYNQLNAAAGASSNNLTLVDRAEVPTKPYSPRLVLNIIIALVIGLIVAAGVVFLRELFDDTIRSPDDVERKLGMPLLGLIPLEKDGDVQNHFSDHRSKVSEAFRSLVTNLRYSTASGLPHVLLVTSSRESEGKSTTARAVANDIALLGKRVLLVDADLRRPTLHRLMTNQKATGLTDVLTGQKAFDEAVHGSGMETLSYMSALPVPPDPALILAGEGLATFVEQARQRFDTVVIDCPPLLGLSDAALLANHADGVLFVIDASEFHRGAVKSALRRLALIKANVLGVVLNRFDPRVGAEDYSYYTNDYYSYGSKQD